METLVEDENKNLIPVVENYMKGKKDYSIRNLSLSESEIEIFKKVRAINKEYNYIDNDYIFCDKNGRMNTRKLDSRLRYISEKAGFEKAKSSHDIRRTVATELFINGVELELIRGFLGHRDIKTTKEYIYDFDREEKESQILINGRLGLNGLKTS